MVRVDRSRDYAFATRLQMRRTRTTEAQLHARVADQASMSWAGAEAAVNSAGDNDVTGPRGDVDD